MCGDYRIFEIKCIWKQKLDQAKLFKLEIQISPVLFSFFFYVFSLCDDSLLFSLIFETPVTDRQQAEAGLSVPFKLVLLEPLREGIHVFGKSM